MVKVSVIMPVYNVERYLRPCLDSVIAQTLQEIEIICVDDGSTDSSPEILQEYAKKDARVRVICQENRYAGAARNAGIEEASGKYLVFWDSDDLFDRKALQKLYERCEKDKAQVAVCGARRLDNETGRIYHVGVYVVRKNLPGKLPFSKTDIPGKIFNITTNVPWNKMFLREFVEKEQLRFQCLRQANDLYFVMMALYRADRITVVDQSLITYREANRHSLTGKASENRFCVAEAYRAVYRELMKDTQFDEQIQRSFANKALDSLLYSLRTQWNMQSFRELYDLYKEQLFEEFGIGNQAKGYYYNSDQAKELEQIRQLDSEQYMMHLFHSYERRYQLLNGNNLVRAQRLLRRLIGKLLRR